MSGPIESSGHVTVSGLATVNAMPINIHAGSGANKPISFFSGSDGNLSLNVNVSGGSITAVSNVSGQVVQISTSSGLATIVANFSGQYVNVAASGVGLSHYSGALNVNISGGSIMANVSGNVVRIASSGSIPYSDYSGALNVNISGGVFATNVSGNVVRVASSGSVIITDYSGALNVNTVRRLDRVQVTWSGNTTSFSLSSGVTAYSDEFYGLYAASGATGNAFGLYNTVVLGVNTSGFDKSGTATFAIFGRFVSGGTVYQDGLGIISGTTGYLINYKSGQGATTTLGFLPSFSFILSSIAQVSGETVSADLIGLV